MKKSDIIAEYNRAEIHYQAMKCLMKSAGITPDDPTPAPTPTPEPTPTPTPEPIPTEPGIVYNGDTNVVLKYGESKQLDIYFNGVNSTSDYVVIPNITSMAYSIKAIKTASGYKDEIAVKGISSGSFKFYLKAAPDKGLTINITIRG